MIKVLHAACAARAACHPAARGTAPIAAVGQRAEPIGIKPAQTGFANPARKMLADCGYERHPWGGGLGSEKEREAWRDPGPQWRHKKRTDWYAPCHAAYMSSCAATAANR